ncbi:DUF3313 family protein [Maricaulis salignorans]|uniref:DUF3313 domain-containing protein n=1 Tax=Maricaulis salignorans TaxID=144026 RepID=A0A1G9N6T3_9PROT|nr:DUF3313 family protein [Maricaulis salignorans]SDL82190.1 Protein of unknown function [Maricaulis salignorans]
MPNFNPSLCLIPVLALLATGCAANGLQQAETLSDYRNLQTSDRRLLQVREWVDPQALRAVEAVYIPQAGIVPGVVEDSGVDPARFNRIVGKLNQTMCRRLARSGFQVTADPEMASHELRMTVTGFETTNRVSAGASRLIGFAIPGPLSPRIPIGIGALAVEGEMLDATDTQIAALAWSSRNHLVSSGGFSEIGDGYDLAQVFADSFGDLIVSARDSVDGARSETERGVCSAMFAAATAGDAEAPASP